MGSNMITSLVDFPVREKEDSCLDQRPLGVKIVRQFIRNLKVADRQSLVLRPVPHPPPSQEHTLYAPPSHSGPILECLVLEVSQLPLSSYEWVSTDSSQKHP